MVFLCISVVIVCGGIAKPLHSERSLTLEQPKVFRAYFVASRTSAARPLSVTHISSLPLSQETYPNIIVIDEP